MASIKKAEIDSSVFKEKHPQFRFRSFKADLVK